MKSIREIYKIGKGPSSSHTMGPERAANHFNNLYPEANRFQVILCGSLSKTGVGHGTGRVIREVLSPDIYPENSFAEIADFCKWRYIHKPSDYVELNEGEDI